MTRLIFMLALQVVGYGLIAYSCGWLPAIGLFLLFWQRNIRRTMEIESKSQINAVKYGGL